MCDKNEGDRQRLKHSEEAEEAVPAGEKEIKSFRLNSKTLSDM